jgi:hypothetical protein
VVGAPVGVEDTSLLRADHIGVLDDTIVEFPERWVQEQQDRFPLSRRTFTKRVKEHGFHADRTKSARIWRGLTW